VKQKDAEPLHIDTTDEEAVREAIVGEKITIVLFLIDALKAGSQVFFIKALAEVKKITGTEVYFLHVSAWCSCRLRSIVRA